MTRLVLSCVALALAACGASDSNDTDAGPRAPVSGDSCGQMAPGTAVCDGARATLVCVGNTLHAYPCHGVMGCARTNSQDSDGGYAVVCDVTGNIAGDPCAPAMETAAFCVTQGVSAILRCTGGVWTAGECEAGACLPPLIGGGPLSCR